MHEANAEELETLENWLQQPGNKALFAEYIKVNYAIDMNTNPFDAESAKKTYLEKIREDKRKQKKRKLINTFRYAAAILILVLASTYFLKDILFPTSTVLSESVAPIIINNTIKPGIDKATLTLEDGSEMILEKGASIQTPHAKSNGEEITYDESVSAELAYNYLSVPRGGQFFLKLSDGTKVWLNSETQLKYPVSFREGESRQVELLYGEAYFDVSPSTEHKGADFKVRHEQQDVQVFGTAFNIKAYMDETNIYTTLVEGKVSVNFENQSEILEPGEQSNLNILTKALDVTTVDLYDQISWRKGVFSFKRKPLKDIMQVLARWYNMDVEFDNKRLESIGFSGVLGKEQGIEEVLETLKDIDIIKNYEINNKKVTLK